MTKITVTCEICNTILVTAEGPNLTQIDADNYQQTVSCDTDGQTSISAILTEEE